MPIEKLVEEIKLLIIETIGLEDYTTDDLNETEPLLTQIEDIDSVDLLEIALAVEKKYNVKIGNVKKSKEIFKSVKTIAEYVKENMNVAS